MENLPALKKGTYVIAVSGGVDSVALLHALQKQTELTIIVAHFDHGIRPDSSSDEQFVAGLARQYNLAYASEREELGQNASEETARHARYNFLLSVKKEQGAQAIITAHHADDIIETMVLNLIRGTGWRGLCSLRNTPGLLRPLLAVAKKDIVKYAKNHTLSWREDSTNNDERHLRNAIRRQLMPHVERQAWLDLYEKQLELAQLIDNELHNLHTLTRYHYIMWPRIVSVEMLKKNIGVTRAQAEYVLSAIKTGASGNIVTAGNSKKLMLTRDSFVVAPL